MKSKLNKVLIVFCVLAIFLLSVISCTPQTATTITATMTETATVATTAVKTTTQTATATVTAQAALKEMYASYWSADSWPGRSNTIFLDIVESVCDGRLVFDRYPGGQIYSTYSAVINSVVTGVQPIGFGYPPMLAAYDERWNVLGFPGAILGPDHLQKVHFESKEYQKLNEDLGNNTGIRMLMWEFVIPFGDIPFNTKRPLVTVEDWKGLKLRAAPTDIQELSIKAFGASPVVLQTSETLPALSQGTVEGGIITPATAVTSWKADEILPYLTVPYGGWNFTTSPLGFYYNVDWWENTLPDDLKDAILNAIPDIVAASQKDVDATCQAAFDKYAAKNTVTYLTQEQTKVWDDLVSNQVMPAVLEKTPGAKQLYDDFRSLQ